jgi:hypothetical protein
VAELSHRERVPGARLVWLFRAAPAPVQRALVSAGRQVPGRSVRWGSLRRLRPFSDRYGYDCVMLTQVLQFLSPETALVNIWSTPAPGGVLMLTAPSLARVDPHDPGTDFWRFTPNGLAELLHPRFPLVACAHAEKAR